MGTDTIIRIWRRFNNKIGSQEEIIALREQYKLRNAADDWTSEKENHAAEHEKDMPILLEHGFKAERSIEAEEVDPRFAWGNEDNKLYSYIGSFFFGRGFSRLRDYFGLCIGKRSTCTAFMSKNDVKKIVQAARYLLNGQFSDEFESMLDNEFIKVLGEDYPKWELRKFKNNRKIYLDQESTGHWSISLGDPEGDREVEEENSNAEWMLKKLENCLAGVLEFETGYNGEDDIVFEICAF